MKTRNGAGQRARDLAAERLAEIDSLSLQIRETLAEMIANFDKTTGVFPKSILDKLNQLHASHLRVLVAEDAFHDKIGQDPDADAIDYDAIRAALGRQLDRLRECQRAGRLPDEADFG